MDANLTSWVDNEPCIWMLLIRNHIHYHYHEIWLTRCQITQAWSIHTRGFMRIRAGPCVIAVSGCPNYFPIQAKASEMCSDTIRRILSPLPYPLVSSLGSRKPTESEVATLLSCGSLLICFNLSHEYHISTFSALLVGLGVNDSAVTPLSRPPGPYHRAEGPVATILRDRGSRGWNLVTL